MFSIYYFFHIVTGLFFALFSVYRHIFIDRACPFLYNVFVILSHYLQIWQGGGKYVNNAALRPQNNEVLT